MSIPPFENDSSLCAPFIACCVSKILLTDMTLNEFLALDYQGRLRATNHAVCIGGRNDAGHMILLYQLNGFYIEVYYNKQSNFISNLFGFDDMDRLDPYLGKIEISLTYD